MNGINASFMEMAASLDRPLSLEPESGLRDLTYLAHDVSTWGYWDVTGLNSTSLAPPVSAYKLLENRHMVHISDRWGGGDGVPRMDGMQYAYFNGVGYETCPPLLRPSDPAAQRATHEVVGGIRALVQGRMFGACSTKSATGTPTSYELAGPCSATLARGLSMPPRATACAGCHMHRSSPTNSAQRPIRRLRSPCSPRSSKVPARRCGWCVGFPPPL